MGVAAEGQYFIIDFGLENIDSTYTEKQMYNGLVSTYSGKKERYLARVISRLRRCITCRRPLLEHCLAGVERPSLIRRRSGLSLSRTCVYGGNVSFSVVNTWSLGRSVITVGLTVVTMPAHLLPSLLDQAYGDGGVEVRCGLNGELASLITIFFFLNNFNELITLNEQGERYVLTRSS